jgi:superfamily II DNA helicase RecQ
MPVRIFTIPFEPQSEIFSDEEFSRFLLNKQVKRLQPEFFQTDGRAYWTVFVEYETISGPESNVQDGLDEGQRLLFQRLREWRAEKAEKEGIPVFIIATNKQLIDVIKRKPNVLEGLREINGFGQKKVDRHGKEILEIVKAFHSKKPIKRPDAKPTDKAGIETKVGKRN